MVRKLVSSGGGCAVCVGGNGWAAGVLSVDGTGMVVVLLGDGGCGGLG